MSALTARKVLEKAIKKGGEWYGEYPTTLKLSGIGRLEDLFQHRKPARHRSRQHIKTLAKVPGKLGRDLSPIRVWWAGNERGWLCIDGHHRLDAYQEAGRTEPVPVEVFTGTLNEAHLEALRSNTRDQLTMDGREKLNAAWRTTVVVGDACAKRTIAEAAGVAVRTVANMRKVAKLFRKKWPIHDPTEFSWRNAQLLVQGEEAPSLDAEAAREERLKKLTDALISKFGPTMSRDPALFAEALRRCDPALPDALREAFEQWEEDAKEPPTEPIEEATWGSLPFAHQSPGEVTI